MWPPGEQADFESTGNTRLLNKGQDAASVNALFMN